MSIAKYSYQYSRGGIYKFGMATPVWFVNLIKIFFPFRKKIASLSQNLWVKKIMDDFLFKGDAMVILHKDRLVIHENIEPPQSTVLPSSIVHHFIDQANHLWIMNHCLCREGDDCQDYPHDLGCLFMGEAVLGINPRLGRLATRAEAHAHIQRAQSLGLVHLIGRNKLDTIWMGVGPGDQLMTVCNCCPCCCLFKILPDLHPELSASVSGMPGVKVYVNGNCTSCGRCIREQICFVNAIRMEGDRVIIGDDCRSCGRCVEFCRQKAILIEFSEQNYIHQTIKTIEDNVKIN
jgi:ferredoxin